MSEAVEGGAAIAWRLLATLEGGSLLLAASAILAYTARGRSTQKTLPCRNVAITNATSDLGRALTRRLEAHGCVVAVPSDASGAGKYDALVVVGAQATSGLDGLADLVTEDVYTNIKILENLSARVNRGGCIAWACAGNKSLGAYDDAAAAFDTVLQASLVHIAKVFHCVPIWVGRCSGAERAAEQVVAALMTCDTRQDSRYSVRNAVNTVGGYIYRWLKTIT